MFVYTDAISTTIASIAGGTGLTSFTITSASGLPSTTGQFCTARIADGTANAEDITCTLSGTTVTCSATTKAHSNGDAIAFSILSKSALDAFKDDAIAGFPENALSAAGALVKGAGQANRITITSASATFTLADGTYKGEVCRIIMDPSCTKLATIDPAGTTTIDGATTRIMWAGETALLAWTGTEWTKIAGKSIPMIGAMYLASTTASFANAAYTQVALDTSEVDNTGLMVNTGANKITTQRPGYYMVSFELAFLMGSNNGLLLRTSVFQGATEVASGNTSSIATGWAGMAGQKPVLAAAADDFIMKGYQNSGLTTPVVQGGRNITYMSLVELPRW